MPKIKTFEDKMQDLYGDEFEKIFITGEEPLGSISTGALSLDTSIGIGGIPRGRFTIVEGAEGSGKSSLALSICKNALLNGIKTIYVDVENQMDFSYMQDLIDAPIDNNNFLLAKPKNSDVAFNIIEAAIEEGHNLVVLDSIAALSPPEEQEKKWEQASMAIMARDLAKFFRRDAYKVRTNNSTILFINQVRDNIGAYIKSYTSPGGHALKHYSSLTVFLSRGQEIKAGDETIGIMTKFTIKKNKMAPPFRSFLLPIIFGKGVDTLRDTISYAEFLGIIRRAGPYYKLEDRLLGKGMLETMATLEEDKEGLDKIKNMCYNVIRKYDKEIMEEGDIEEGVLNE